MHRKSPRSGKRSAAPALAKAVRTQREPLEQSQVLISKAWEATTARQAASLARQALEICPDCADAYTILAESEARSAEEACQWYQQGVEAGRRRLGETIFAQQTGHFCQLPETRPYMRARQGLADCLWALGRREESLAHSEALLELNPEDDQGIRQGLLSRYLTVGHEAGAERLLHRYAQDSSAAFLWSRVLLDLRREDQAAAKDDLRAAMQGNPHVADLFSGKRTPPARLPERFTPGDRHEAALYFAGFAEAWLASSEAMEWLMDQLTK